MKKMKIQYKTHRMTLNIKVVFWKIISNCNLYISPIFSTTKEAENVYNITPYKTISMSGPSV